MDGAAVAFFTFFFFFFLEGAFDEVVELSKRTFFELVLFFVGFDSWVALSPEQFKRLAFLSSRRSLVLPSLILLSM